MLDNFEAPLLTFRKTTKIVSMQSYNKINTFQSFKQVCRISACRCSYKSLKVKCSSPLPLS